MQVLVDYIVPCVLCEEPLEHVTVYRSEAGAEHSTREPLPHRCAQMKALLREGSK